MKIVRILHFLKIFKFKKILRQINIFAKTIKIKYKMILLESIYENEI